MPNPDVIAKLNELLSDIKVLVGSLSILDKANTSKDLVSAATALDAINFRVREINKTVGDLHLKNLLTNPLELEIDQVLLELSKPNPDAKILHSLLNDQIETLRKIALSEILTLSIE